MYLQGTKPHPPMPSPGGAPSPRGCWTELSGALALRQFPACPAPHSSLEAVQQLLYPGMLPQWGTSAVRKLIAVIYSYFRTKAPLWSLWFGGSLPWPRFETALWTFVSISQKDRAFSIHALCTGKDSQPLPYSSTKTSEVCRETRRKVWETQMC